MVKEDSWEQAEEVLWSSVFLCDFVGMFIGFISFNNPGLKLARYLHTLPTLIPLPSPRQPGLGYG